MAAELRSASCSRRSRSAWVFFYSYTKRFTRWSHLVLGLGLGIAPVGGYLAVTGAWSDPWWMLVALAARRDVLGGRLRHPVRAAGHRVRPRATDCTRCRRRSASARALRDRARAARVHRGCCSRWWASPPGRRARSTAPAWRWRRGCSCTSTRSCTPTTSLALDAAFFTMNGVLSIVLRVRARGATCWR